jgi:hypothetical protein
MHDRLGLRDRNEARRTRPEPAPVRRDPHGLGVGSILALQRTAGNHAVTAMLARVHVDFIPDRSEMSVTRATTTEAMTDSELEDVIANAGAPYGSAQVDGAKEELDKRKTAIGQPAIELVQSLLKPEIDDIAKKAIAIVDELNTHSTSDLRFDALFEELKALRAGVFQRFKTALTGKTHNPAALNEVRANVTKPIAHAVTRVGTIRNQITATKTRDELIDEEPIVYPGAKTLLVIQYDDPTIASTLAISRPGVQALKAHGFSDPELHHTYNALAQGYKLSGDCAAQIERWLSKLDAMATLWADVKPESAKAWLRKALLPKGTSLWAHYKGMFGELWETHRVLAEGDFEPGTKIRMGKDKLRPETTGMKQNAKPTTTQDIDLSFHGADGKRHYHEVKADPDTIVGKIGGDETKAAVLGAPSEELKNTPDQVLSYASARDAHQLKPSKTPDRYPTGKSIVLMYVAPSSRNWLRIFTSKAGRRLIDHGFELRVGATTFDATSLALVQAKVDTVAPKDDPARDVWARTNSATLTSLYGDPAQFLTS